MATIQEVVEARLNRYNIEMDAVELDVMLANQNLIGSETYTSGHEVAIKTAFVSIIPELLLLPDISEGGYSRKFDKSAITAFYGMLCAELGLENKLEAKQPVVRDRSSLW